MLQTHPATVLLLTLCHVTCKMYVKLMQTYDKTMQIHAELCQNYAELCRAGFGVPEGRFVWAFVT